MEEVFEVSTRAEFKDAVRRIRNNDPTLTEFGVGFYSQLPKTLDEGDIDQMLVALSNNTRLVHFSLTCDKFGGDHARTLSEIILKGALPLTSLFLACGTIRAVGAEALSKVLMASSSLEELDLYGNRIGNSGAKAFAKALEDNSTLKRLHLGRNNIGCDGGTALFNALEKNTALQELHLCENRIGCKAARALSKALKKNTTIDLVFLHNNPIKKDGLRAIEKAMRDNTTLWRIHLNNSNDSQCQSIVQAIQDMAMRNLLLKSHRRDIAEFGTAFYVLRSESDGRFQWAQTMFDDGIDEGDVYSIWEALTGDGMVLQLVLDVFSEIVKNGPADVAALKALVETERNEHGDTLLHAAVTKDSNAALELSLFLVEEVGVDMHRALNGRSRSVFNMAGGTMTILKKMEFARLCRDAGKADAYADALIDIVDEPRAVKSALYYLIREKPEVANPTFWVASATSRA